MNVDTYRSTISEMLPVDDEMAMGVRDTVWLSCHIARSIQDWAMYADAFQKEHGVKILTDNIVGRYWENWGWALRGLLHFGGARVDIGVADAIILRVIENERI